MSRKDYTKFSNRKTEPKVVEKQEPIVKEEVVVVDEPKEVPIVELKSAIVIDCARLNVREEPKTDAKVVREIPVYTQVMVDVINSTDNFYKVYLADGVEGFCMKDYIEIE